MTFWKKNPFIIKYKAFQNNMQKIVTFCPTVFTIKGVKLFFKNGVETFDLEHLGLWL